MTFSSTFPTLQRFLDTVEDVRRDKGEHYDYGRGNHGVSPLPLEASWTTGGIGGGNCWNEGGHYAITAEEEPELKVVDEVLEAVCPQMTFLQYRRLMKRDFILRSESSQHEYYGNHTEYARKELDLPAFYEALKSVLDG